MQGRLSKVINGVIQEFPWESWRDEFMIADEIGIHTMEWTLDQKDLYLNPLMSKDGQEEILRLIDKWSICIPSLTGDCFMQHPFWKVQGKKQEQLLLDFKNILQACGALNIGIIVIPLVDNGSLENMSQENELIQILEEYLPLIKKMNLRIAFESDFPAEELSRFISRLELDVFGINYDIGNSAALGYMPDNEFLHYGNRIINVHVKDRPFGMTTVPLGLGDANFDKVFKNLANHNYKGNYILQTARDTNGEHAEVISKYLSQTKSWIKQNES
jgi:hexulose-6-phosphate isomerase